MSFDSRENVRTYKTETAIVKGTFVKFGTDDESVVTCGANEDMIGVAQDDADDATCVEVAKAGSGAVLLLGATLARGVFVKSDANGKAVAAGTARTGAMVAESGILDDLVGCEVMLFQQA